MKNSKAGKYVGGDVDKGGVRKCLFEEVTFELRVEEYKSAIGNLGAQPF